MYSTFDLGFLTFHLMTLYLFTPGFTHISCFSHDQLLFVSIDQPLSITSRPFTAPTYTSRSPDLTALHRLKDVRGNDLSSLSMLWNLKIMVHPRTEKNVKAWLFRFNNVSLKYVFSHYSVHHNRLQTARK